MGTLTARNVITSRRWERERERERACVCVFFFWPGGGVDLHNAHTTTCDVQYAGFFEIELSPLEVLVHDTNADVRTQPRTFIV